MSDQSTPATGQAAPKPGDIIRAKWVMDGATTLAEAADRLEVYAAWLREQHAAGWTLSQPVDDDYGFLISPDGDTGPDGDDDNEG